MSGAGVRHRREEQNQREQAPPANARRASGADADRTRCVRGTLFGTPAQGLEVERQVVRRLKSSARLLLSRQCSTVDASAGASTWSLTTSGGGS